VDALLATEEQEKEDRGIEVLTKAHQETGAYRFKMRIGDVRIRQMSRRRRELLTKGDKDGDAQLAREQLEFELKEFAERVANYPTDLGLKYELGRRELATEKYDDAIVSFQHAQRDPRRRILAMTYLGTAFAKKGLLREAAETFERTLESELTEERTKELRYNLGTVLEQMGHLERAQEELSKVAQIDYAYEDVSRRLDAVRKKIEQQSHPET